MTNVPIPTLGPNGYVAPTEQDVLAGVWADLNAAFGGNLNPSPTEPQGQIAVSQAAVIGYMNDLFLFYTNQVDPAYASGRMQDAIGRFYFLERNPAAPTTVQAVCSGATGTIIPTGALAITNDGYTFICTGGGTIPAGGNITLTFANIENGPIPCVAGSLNGIYQTIPGWDSITNPADGVLGVDVESRVAFETRRSESVALNAIGILSAIRGSVLNVPGVVDAYVTENDTGSPVTINGVTIVAHSLYVAVSGGADADVAKAIWIKKPPGCNYNGSTTVTVADDNSGYNLPYPTYDVKFTRPDPLPVLFAVTIADSLLVPSGAANLIKSAILAAFYGTDGGTRARIGSTIFASRFYAGIAALGPWAQIISLKIGTVTATADEVSVKIDEQPTLDSADITVTLV